MTVAGSNGMAPRNGSSYCFASCSPPPFLNRIDFLPAVRTAQPAHVLDDAEDRGLYLLEEIERFADVGKGNLLRRGHDDTSSVGDGIQHGQMFITRTGRGIDDQIVQSPPLYVGQKLSDGPRFLGAAPEDRRVLILRKESMEISDMRSPQGTGSILPFSSAMTDAEAPSRRGTLGP